MLWPESLAALRDMLAVASSGRRMEPLASGSQPTGRVGPVLILFLPQWHYLHIGGTCCPTFASTA